MRPLWRVGAAVLILAVGSALVFTVWALNAYEVTPEALAAVRADPDVHVRWEDGYVAVLPADAEPDRGVVFYPGARVAPDAYVPTWAPIVERAEIAVFIPAMPLNFAFFAQGRARTVMAAEEGIDEWWVGGHSLGGAAAAGYAGGTEPGELAGLILWGAYATAGAGLEGRDDLAVLSVSGTRDGLATPQEIADRRDVLPGGAETIAIEGMNHAQFGRYGAQPGDRRPAITDAQAEVRLAAAVAGFLDVSRSR